MELFCVRATVTRVLASFCAKRNPDQVTLNRNTCPKALRPKEEGLYRITSRFFYKVSKFISDISDIYHFLKNMHAFGLIFIL
jgi:hypothetical protein